MRGEKSATMAVLDCSAAVCLALEGPESESLSDLMLSGETVIAPDLYVAEVTHAMQKYVRAGVLTKEGALGRARECVGMVDRLVPASALYLETLSESLRLGHSSYDLFYFVLARRTASTLFTLDRRLQDLCLKNGVSCVLGLTVDDERWDIRAETIDGPAIDRSSGTDEQDGA